MNNKINFGGIYTTADGKKYKLISEATNYKRIDKVYLFVPLDNIDTTGAIIVNKNELSDFTFQYNTYQ